MIEEQGKQLKNPENTYRSAPFWAFNGWLEEEELRRQIQEMKEQGMGGFFIHSREGLETPYLQEEWMNCVRACVDEASKQEMEVWIYDEDKWPSGSAGGLVSRKKPKEFTAKGITLEAISVQEAVTRKEKGILTEGVEYPDGKIVGLYTVGEENGNLKELAWGLRPEMKGNKVLLLRREISANSEWYNGNAPTDTLNPQAVKEFLSLTHEAYKEQIGQEFGKTVRGFFTDEPNCCDFYAIFTEGRPWLPWTDELSEFFRERRGYDPVPLLPYLFYGGELASKMRHDFWRTIAERFQEAYMKQLYEWCEQEGVESTGHMLYENDLGYQTRVCGAAMPQYAYLHRPGIDLLGEQTKEYLTVKQCISVARQYGRKHTITETYGCTGWELGFEGQKWLGDWQFVMGIDRRCQHLAQYSISGCRKRDYPPVFSYQTTWWKYNYLLENYFSRISLIMGRGHAVVNVLVLHPMSSIWTRCGSKETEDLTNIEMNMGWMDSHITSLNQWGEAWNRLAQSLEAAHIGFDFGDEMLLEKDGSVESKTLCMGECRYQIVVVAGLSSIFENTRILLEKFSKAGGRILFGGSLPSMIEGKTATGLEQKLKNLPGAVCVDAMGEIPEALRKFLPFQYRIMGRVGQEESELLSTVRKTEEGYVLFVVNNDRKEERTAVVEFPVKGKVMVYDPWMDVSQEIKVEKKGERAITFLIKLTPAQSRIYEILEDKEPMWGKVEFPYVHPHYTEPVFAALGPTAFVRRTMENVLTLDTCRYRLGHETFSQEMQVWQAQREIRERLGMRQVYYNGAPQRYFWLDEPCDRDGTEFELEFCFVVRESLDQICQVAVEKASEFKIRLNGVECPMEKGYFMERQMNRFTLPFMKTGEQKLVISGKYDHSMELEDIYIIGNFTVDMFRQIGRESGKLHFGDWCFQGYYHYPGSMVYEFDFAGIKKRDKRYILKMGEYWGTLAVVRLNDREAGYLMGKTERELDITMNLNDGENHLEIEIVGSPRNMFGPFHQKYTGCSRISWADFRTEGKLFTSDYVLKPYGILDQIFIVERESE